MQEKEDNPTPEELFARATKGAGAEGAARYLGDLLWSRLWRNITAISNCDPEKTDLIMALRASIQEDMYLAQTMKLDVFESRNAIKRLKDAYGIK